MNRIWYMTKTLESKLEMLKTLTEIPKAMFQESKKYSDKEIYSYKFYNSIAGLQKGANLSTEDNGDCSH